MIIEDLLSTPPSAIIDPFCGTGSSAVVARELGVPFLGIDLDPLMACVTLAKTFCDDDLPEGLLRDCLALTLSLGGLDESQARLDLAEAPGAVEGSRVHCGDAGAPETWEGLWCPPGWVMYTSPPFRTAQPYLPPDAVEHDIAASLLEVSRGAAATSAGYLDTTLAMLGCLKVLPKPGLIMLEHEPSEVETDDVLAVAQRIHSSGAATVREVRKTANFSTKGTLSLILCEV